METNLGKLLNCLLEDGEFSELIKFTERLNDQGKQSFLMGKENIASEMWQTAKDLYSKLRLKLVDLKFLTFTYVNRSEEFHVLRRILDSKLTPETLKTLDRKTLLKEIDKLQITQPFDRKFLLDLLSDEDYGDEELLKIFSSQEDEINVSEKLQKSQSAGQNNELLQNSDGHLNNFESFSGIHQSQLPLQYQDEEKKINITSIQDQSSNATVYQTSNNFTQDFEKIQEVKNDSHEEESKNEGRNLEGPRNEYKHLPDELFESFEEEDKYDSFKYAQKLLDTLIPRNLSDKNETEMIKKKALDEIDEMIKKSSNPDLKLQLMTAKAKNFLSSKELKKAESVLSQILQIRPHYAYAHYLKAQLHLYKKDYKQALELINELNKFGERAVYYYVKGEALEYLGEKPKACDAFEQAIKLQKSENNQDFLCAYVRKAALLHELSHFQEATKLLKFVIHAEAQTFDDQQVQIKIIDKYPELNGEHQNNTESFLGKSMSLFPENQ